MILTQLKGLLGTTTQDVLNSKGKDVSLPPFDLSPPPSKISGDLAANISLMLAKKIGQSPRDLAEDIIRAFPKNELIRKMEVAGPGFVNFWMTDDAFLSELEVLITDREKSVIKKKTGQRILFEFVSANPTGPLHIGHGRGAALGDSLVRIYRYLGYDVESEFYINDAGGQIRNLGYSMQARIDELQGKKTPFPETGYKGSYVVDLAKEAAASKKMFHPVTASQMIFTEDDLAGFASTRILKRIQKDLADFGVHFDHWCRESDLHARKIIPRLLKELEDKGMAYQQDGAFWFKATEYGDEKDRVLKKTNEAPTYFAADIAYHEDKLRRGYTKLVNVWGADHHGYAQRLKGALQAIDKRSEDISIILNQMVSLKGGRLSKRAGDMVTLRDVIDDVGKDAARFFFALRSPGAHFEFDLDLAKKQAADNPVYYVQYVHARCASIFREAEKRGIPVEPLGWRKGSFSHALDEVEKNVLLHLMSFERTLEMCARDFSNHHLTIYLMELAGKYHTFYERCRVLDGEEGVRGFRLDLVAAIRKRVAEGLDLLGVSAPDKL